MTTDDGVVDEGGEAPCFAHLFEEALVVTDGVLATLVRQLADAVIISDAHGTIRFWNDAAARVFGWSGIDAVGKTLDLIIPERLRERHWAGYRHTMTTSETTYSNRLLEVPALHRERPLHRLHRDPAVPTGRPDPLRHRRGRPGRHRTLERTTAAEGRGHVVAGQSIRP